MKNVSKLLTNSTSKSAIYQQRYRYGKDINSEIFNLVDLLKNGSLTNEHLSWIFEFLSDKSLISLRESFNNLNRDFCLEDKILIIDEHLYKRKKFFVEIIQEKEIDKNNFYYDKFSVFHYISVCCKMGKQKSLNFILNNCDIYFNYWRDERDFFLLLDNIHLVSEERQKYLFKGFKEQGLEFNLIKFCLGNDKYLATLHQHGFSIQSFFDEQRNDIPFSIKKLSMGDASQLRQIEEDFNIDLTKFLEKNNCLNVLIECDKESQESVIQLIHKYPSIINKAYCIGNRLDRKYNIPSDDFFQFSPYFLSIMLGKYKLADEIAKLEPSFLLSYGSGYGEKKKVQSVKDIFNMYRHLPPHTIEYFVSRNIIDYNDDFFKKYFDNIRWSRSNKDVAKNIIMDYIEKVDTIDSNEIEQAVRYALIDEEDVRCAIERRKINREVQNSSKKQNKKDRSFKL